MTWNQKLQKHRLHLIDQIGDAERRHPSQMSRITPITKAPDLCLPSHSSLLRHLLNYRSRIRTMVMCRQTRIWRPARATHLPAHAFKVNDVSLPRGNEPFPIAAVQFRNSISAPIPLRTTTINFLRTLGNAQDHLCLFPNQNLGTSPIEDEDLMSTRFAKYFSH